MKNAITHITQRQPSASPVKPPTTGPTTGPMKGAAANSDMARPRCLAPNMSAMVPPALVMGEDPNAPAKKRSTMSAAMLGASATPQLKAVSAK